MRWLLAALLTISSAYAVEEIYDYAIVLGGQERDVRARLQFLQQEWQRGTLFKKVILLTGSRPIDHTQEKICGCMKTESEMMAFLYEEMEISEELSKTPLEVVDGGSSAEALQEWLRLNPCPGTCLMITCSTQ